MWRERRRKIARIYQRRMRRPSYGELIQIDGSPQDWFEAKGRVERANQTLQNRLVKELRLQGISDIETANAWLPKFIEAYNNRFATAPRDSANAHLDVHHSEEELNHIFSYQVKRVLAKKPYFSVQNQCVPDTH